MEENGNYMRELSMENTIYTILDKILLSQNSTISYTKRKKLIDELFTAEELESKGKFFSSCYMKARINISHKNYSLVNKIIKKMS